MESDLQPQYVSALKMIGSRVEADVILGSTKVRVVVDVRDSPEMNAALKEIVKKAREDLATNLENDLSPSTRKALKP